LAGTHRCEVTDAIRFSLAVEEALLNALVHGNLEMTQLVIDAELQLGSKAFLEHCATSPFRDRKIDVRFCWGDSKAEVNIRDEGPGFDVRQYMGSSALASFHGGRGRGFTLMRAFTDELHFSPEGNTVRLVKHFKLREALGLDGEQ
jgi:anti-sigma regulatory factor (Ser/Thr protein kinase)